MPGQQPGMPMAPGQMNQGGMPPKPAPQGMPQQPGMPMAPGQMNQQQMQNVPPPQRFLMACQKILPSCSEKNPHLKEQVGQAIFEFVGLLVQSDRAPKITGMLIELPIAQIQQFMQSWEIFQQKVNEANGLIEKAANMGQL